MMKELRIALTKQDGSPKSEADIADELFSQLLFDVSANGAPILLESIAQLRATTKDMAATILADKESFDRKK